jgi:hypothetical protein
MRILLDQDGDWHPGPPAAGFPNPLIVPSGPADLAAHYDVTLSHPPIDQPQLRSFEVWLAQAARRRGLTCALIHDGVVREAIARLETGRLTVGLHLDYFALWHVTGDPYARLAEAVQEAGGWPINVPHRARFFTDKANAHATLLGRGLGVPATVLFRPGSPDRPLTADERRELGLDEPGARVYLKPANGFSHRGVVCVDRTDPDSLNAAVAAARLAEPQDTLLVQCEVRCPLLDGDDGVERPAYWRVLYCLGDVIPFWWSRSTDPARPQYRLLTARESQRHGLGPVYEFVRDLADLSGLRWFSTEVCLSEGGERSRHRMRTRHGPRPLVAIDYVNDQCDVDVQSRWFGAPPDGVVGYLADRFAAAAATHTRRLTLPAAAAVRAAA